MGIECGSQIVLCDVPIRIDTYDGCSHDCKYCFARRKKGIQRIKPLDCTKQLTNFIKGQRIQTTAWCDWNIPLHFGGMSDPFQPCEKEFGVTKRVLEIFSQTKYPFIVSTKGRLICEPEYLELIRDCNAVVQISMVCDKYDILERGAPSYCQRLQMLEKLQGNCKRLIVRIQPFMREVRKEVIGNLKALADAGVYGITVEGMKFIKQKPGLIKLGGDYVYPVTKLKTDMEAIRSECHKVGLKFFCAENRLRTMGDDMTCCGCAGLQGFNVNKFNLEHLYNGEKVQASKAMQQQGTALCYKSIFQDAGSHQRLKAMSMADIMQSRELFNSYLPIILGGYERVDSPEKRLEFTTWLRSTGITAQEVNALTGTQMSSHYLCAKIDGQTEIPTPEMFVRLLKSEKIQNVPNRIKQLVYGEQANKKKKYDDIFIADDKE